LAGRLITDEGSETSLETADKGRTLMKGQKKLLLKEWIKAERPQERDRGADSWQ
jgi:hypothetical protein